MARNLWVVFTKRWAVAALVVVFSLGVGIGFSPAVHADTPGKGKVQPNYILCQYTHPVYIAQNSFSNAGYTLNVYLAARYDNTNTGVYCGEMYTDSSITYGSGLSGGWLTASLQYDPNYSSGAACAGDTPSSAGEYWCTTATEGTTCGYGSATFQAGSIYLATSTGHYCP
jgi:hypothetical protein